MQGVEQPYEVHYGEQNAWEFRTLCRGQVSKCPYESEPGSTNPVQQGQLVGVAVSCSSGKLDSKNGLMRTL